MNKRLEQLGVKEFFLLISKTFGHKACVHSIRLRLFSGVESSSTNASLMRDISY